MRLLMLVGVILVLALVAGLSLLFLPAVPLEDEPRQPVAVPRELTRRAGPPTSRWERTWVRITRCARLGHEPCVAFPLGRLARQCRHCGAISRRMTLATFTRERI